LAAAKEVAPHRTARGCDVGSLDCRSDGAMLGLNPFQIRAQLLAAFEPDPHALPRDEKTAEEFEKAHEMRITRCRSDCLMKSKIFVDRAVAALERPIDRGERTGDTPTRGCVCPFGGDASGLDLDAGPQLHDLHDFRNRAQAVRIDAEWATLHVADDKGADALAGLDQTFGAQHRHRLAYHRAAHSERRREFLLGRQPRAGRDAAASDLRREPLDDLAGPVLGRAQWVKEISRKS
jgi:hypothetical protein